MITDTKPILVIGGGIAGMTSAIEAAEIGINVILIEKEAYLGGKAIGMNRYFPKMCPPYCGMEINFRRIKQTPLIRVLTQTQLKRLDGEVGNFTATLEKQAELVNANCTSCGDCANQCQMEEKAIYLPHELAYPEKFTIDEDRCLKDECRKCVEVCQYDAIHLDALPETIVVEIGSIVLATGWDGYDASKIKELSFGKHPDIITNLEMEQLQSPNGPTKGKIIRKQTGEAPKLISFVQCAGSRDQNHLPYCSGVCCSASLKQALHAVDVLPEVMVNIHYIDLRVTGRNEDFLKRVENHPRINLIKGKVSNITIDNDNTVLSWENIEKGLKQSGESELVVLATGMVPHQTPVDPFYGAGRSYTDPMNLPEGAVLAGCAIQPMDVVGSVRSGTGSVARVAGMKK